MLLNRGVGPTVPCPTCGGKGRRKAKSGPWPVFCERCNGTGRCAAVVGETGVEPAPWTDPNPELA
jgi:hypothetical protein